MPSKSRTAMTKLNAKASAVNRVITLVCNFISRTVFIKTLSAEYLGVGGMFGNVFAVISLCELGFGEAVSQAMYEPLSKGDDSKIKGIMRYFSTVYRYVALISTTASLAVMPFLPKIFPDVVKIENYRGVYGLFIINQLLSYRFAPGRSLVISDQRMYVVMNTRSVTSVLVTVSQIAWLTYTENYLGYLFLRIMFQLVDGIAVELYADKKYGLSGSLKRYSVEASFKRKIKSNTASLMLHRIGGVINNSTDSILLSSVLGLSHMGVFSNYSLIINSIGSFIALAISSASASVGNLGVEDNSAKSERILNTLTFANFYLMTNCSSVLLCVINPVIELWIGKDMCFSAVETAVIIACFYMSYIRDPVQIFLRNYGVFKSTRFIPLIRGLLNLVLSYIFVNKYGVAGVFAGTLISTLAVPFLAEPYMLFKHGFGTECKAFVKKYIGYVLYSFMICAVSFWVSSFISSEGIVEIILKGLVSLSFTNAVLIAVFGRNKEFLSLFWIIARRVKRKSTVAIDRYKTQ